MRERGQADPPRRANGAVDLGDQPGALVIAPEAERGRDEIGAASGAARRLLGIADVPSDARHDEDLGPPGDKLGTLIDCVAIAFVRRAESDVIRARLGQAHGIVTAKAAKDADTRLRAQGLARLGVERCIRGKMHAIGADARGERCVIRDETGKPAPLHQSEKGREIAVGLRRDPNKARRLPYRCWRLRV